MGTLNRILQTPTILYLYIFSLFCMCFFFSIWQAPFFYCSPSFCYTALKRLDAPGDLDNEGNQYGPDPDEIKSLLEDALVLLGNENICLNHAMAPETFFRISYICWETYTQSWHTNRQTHLSRPVSQSGTKWARALQYQQQVDCHTHQATHGQRSRVQEALSFLSPKSLRPTVLGKK